MKVIVLADDFTGALDTGVQFTQAGLSTEVLLWTDFNPKKVLSDQRVTAQPMKPPFQVTVVDTESRHIDQKLAYERLFALTSQARLCAYTHFYKKTDSTLRGNIGAEMQAMLNALPYGTLHFLPAYPKMNRQTIKGHQFVQGLPLHETEFASDLLNPTHTAYIPDLLQSQGLHTDTIITCVDTPDDINQIAASSTVELVEPAADRISTLSKQVTIYSAQENKTLEQASHILATSGELVLTAGCAGFAEFLAQRLKALFSSADDQTATLAITTGKHSENATDGNQTNLAITSKTLLLCGSASQASLSQIENYAADHRTVPVHTLSHKEKTPDFWQGQAGRQTIEQLLQQLDQAPLYIIRSVRSKKDIDKTLSAKTIAEAFGVLVRELLYYEKPLNLIIFGGDTVYGMMNAMEQASLHPIAEIAPGIVASKLLVSNSQNTKSLLLVTKAGGLGGPETIANILAWIKNHQLSQDKKDRKP